MLLLAFACESENQKPQPKRMIGRRNGNEENVKRGILASLGRGDGKSGVTW